MTADLAVPQTALETFRQWEKPAPDDRNDRALRAVTAWIAGCGAAALTVLWATGAAELAAGETSAGAVLLHIARRLPAALGLAALALFLTSVPLPLLVWLARINRWRRGRADVAIGGLLGAALVQLFGLPLLDGPAGWATTALAATAGLMGGLVYWLTAGMPGVHTGEKS